MSNTKKTAVVVVPLYRSELGPEEEASFTHNAEVLQKHDVVGVYPDGMDLSFYRRIAPNVQYRAFRSTDFLSVRRYNRLLISPRFYKDFSDYEYMLICHFDAWIFKDELEEWCNKGYDYIGAPFREPFAGKITALFPFLASLCVGKVGNGGLSLRNISTHVFVASVLRWLAPLCLLFMHEDVFFTLVVPLFFKNFRRPDIDEAAYFSIEEKAGESMDELGGAVPFGCHGWFKRYQSVWEQYVDADCGDDFK